MPRGKKRGGLTPRGGGGARGGRGGSRGRGNHPTPTPPSWEQAGFTLMEAARETSKHDHKSWGSSSLRTQPVSFVSAGNIQPLKQLDEDLQKVDAPAVAEDSTVDKEQPDTEQDTTELLPETTTAPTPAHPPSIATPEIGEPQRIGLHQAVASLAAPSPEPAAFFFDTGKPNNKNTKGDDIKALQAEVAKIIDRPSSRHSDSSDEVILFRGRDKRPEPPRDEHLSLTQMTEEITVVEAEMQSEHKVAMLATQKRKPKQKRGRRQREQRPPKRATSDDDAMMADYIENMRANGEEDEMLQMLRSSHDIGGSDYIPSPEDTEGSADEQDASSPKASGASKNLTDTSPLDESKEASDGKYHTESELDDETLAKLLQGHERGENPNPFVSLDDSDDSDSKSDDKPDRWMDDLDVMDWDRPSLRRKKGKAARGQINFQVSDSELEQTLQTAWHNDRFKKAERKRQREEMRALGLLGKRANPEDLRVKYPAGMSLEQVAEEMRVFMISASETLSMPPMDKHARKMIHELANKFNIKSKSIGNGDKRRPTLYRTKRTLQYSEASFDQAVNRINRRYFPRLDASGRRGQGAPRTIGSGRINAAAATVQDGEIVGAAAPELGTENRGRAMLEKMGWSTGTALGAMNNKGILQPVSHAMKRSKAGLG